MLTTNLLLAGLLLAQTPATAPPVAVNAPATVAAPAETPATPPVLSELHTAQVSAHLAKLRALEAELRLQQMALALERERLEVALQAAHPGHRIDWTRGVLVPAEKAQVPPAGKAQP